MIQGDSWIFRKKAETDEVIKIEASEITKSNKNFKTFDGCKIWIEKDGLIYARKVSLKVLE